MSCKFRTSSRPLWGPLLLLTFHLRSSLFSVIDKDAKRPDDWNEDIPEFIPDPHISKPSIWMEEEPLLIPDPAATKPKEWLDEEDGKWTAPLISTFTFSGCT